MDASRIALALRSLRDGNLDVRLPETDPEIGDVAKEYNLLVDQLAKMNAEIARVCDEMGDKSWFGGQVEVPEADGAWRELVSEVNDASRTLTVQIRAIALVLAKKAAGEMDTLITLPAAGEMQELFKSLNAVGKQR